MSPAAAWFATIAVAARMRQQTVGVMTADDDGQAEDLRPRGLG